MKLPMNDELTQQKIRFYKLANGLLAIAYIVGAVYMAVKVYEQIIF
tara:strand:+ start:166 stop:303 length:138 start_codon:yes stop_codon:yes gene_type:complete